MIRAFIKIEIECETCEGQGTIDLEDEENKITECECSECDSLGLIEQNISLLTLKNLLKVGTL